jgi:hypothetical protein
MKTKSLLVFLFLLLLQTAADAQTPAGQKAVGAVERELRQFYDSYAEDLRQHRLEGIANRYDSRGVFSMGNGNKRFVTFEAKETLLDAVERTEGF